MLWFDLAYSYIMSQICSLADYASFNNTYVFLNLLGHVLIYVCFFSLLFRHIEVINQ